MRRLSRIAMAVCLLLAVLTGCAGDADPAGNSRDRFTELPPLPDSNAAQPSPTPAEDPSLVTPEFVIGLLDPGPTLDPSERVFFRNGRDLWQISGDEAAPVLEQGTRFGPYDTSPQGHRVAVVILTEINSQPAQAIHIMTSGDSPGEPILPARVTGGQNAESSIVDLAWSWDTTKLAIVYDDPGIVIVEIAPADGGPAGVLSELALPADVETVESIDWSVTGQGLAFVASTGAGQTSLWVSALDGQVFEVTATAQDAGRSVSSAAWLPGRGRIAFIEERMGASESPGGSMFSIAPDGSGRELLVSAGSFAPAGKIAELSAAPGGRFVAFTVNIPNSQGEATFHALALVDIDSSEIIRIPVAPDFRVTDLWWTIEGLVWRAVHRDAEVVDTISDYSGIEPFLIGRFNPETGEVRAVFQSTAN